MLKIEAPDAYALPDAVFTAKGDLSATQLVTEQNVAWLIDALGFSVSFNQQTRTRVYRHEELDIGAGFNEQNEACEFINDMASRLRMKNLERFGVLTDLIAKRNPFHPMMEWIESKEWDGINRLKQLEQTVPTKQILWPVYLKKWLFQVIEAVSGAENDYTSIPHVLCFSGSQGIGKTSWFSALAPGFTATEMELQLNTPGAKDSMIAALETPITELGEIDSTFKKSEVSALKLMLSRTKDKIRLPYGRIAEVNKRRTVFGGTVNDSQFLMDMSGARRFWVVEVEDQIDSRHDIDMQQLWAQINILFLDQHDSGNTAPWFLTPLEEKRSAREATKHQVEKPSITAIESAFGAYTGGLDNFCLANASEILGLSGVKTDNMFVVNEARHWLEKNLGKSRTLLGKQRCWCVPYSDVRSGGVRIPPDTLIMLTKTKAEIYLEDMANAGFNYEFGRHEKSGEKPTGLGEKVVPLRPEDEDDD